MGLLWGSLSLHLAQGFPELGGTRVKTADSRGQQAGQRSPENERASSPRRTGKREQGKDPSASNVEAWDFCLYGQIQEGAHSREAELPG